MSKRLLTLLLTVALTAVIAPAALADCYKCQIVPAPQVRYCTAATNPLIGNTECYSDETGCYLSGPRCSPGSFAATTPLASDFQVASVQRVEEPASATTTPNVAEPVETAAR